YKEVFPLIKDNIIWLGKGFKGGAAHFISNYTDYATAGDHREGMIRVSGVVWFTNIEHGRRHQPLQLMTMADNLKYSKHKEVKGKTGYDHYDNYDAIEVPYTDAIPSDYEGVMGVPISFLDKYCPEQFEIIWRGGDIDWAEKECNFYTPTTKEKARYYRSQDKTWRIQNPYLLDASDNVKTVYQRIFIRKKK
ncbi:MAG: DNA methyltransferase, partial [Bacteroidaceae bacterium]|nr:DNA methyltransferase [Bacteroidaceae bacterium]